MYRDARSFVSTIRPIGHPQHRRKNFSSGRRDWIRLRSAGLLLLAVQKKAAGRLS